jgi:tellurite resistance protein TerC
VVHAGLWIWGSFVGAVFALLALDLLVLGRRTPSLREAALWSVLWTALGLGFGAILWTWRGGAVAGEYVTGFVIEKSLSLDNLFVFALVFTTLAVPPRLQRRVLFWGIGGAIVLRGAFIAAGGALLETAHAAIYLFGAFLVVTGLRMALGRETEVRPERNPALRLLGRFLPVAGYDGDRFVTRAGRRRAVTPLVAALVLVAVFDVVFAADSIPAIFAITRDSFVVFAANAFSLLGLQALFFLLAGMLGRFEYLKLGLGAILVFVGAKMSLADVVHVPGWLSLTVIVGTLAAAVAASLIRSRSRDEAKRLELAVEQASP